VRDNLGYRINTSEASLLQKTLKEAGYAAGASVSAYALRKSTGVATGLNVYEDDIEFSKG
jgi:hypothetical protein